MDKTLFNSNFPFINKCLYEKKKNNPHLCLFLASALASNIITCNGPSGGLNSLAVFI